MTKTIFDDLCKVKNNLQRLRGDVGIEIETETRDSYSAKTNKFWDAVPDGSLRNFGVEYVLKQPVNVENELEEAMESFKEITKNLKFMESISTSVHVHLNFLNESWLTLANFLTAYCLFENALVRYSGPDRKSNLFCLPIKDAEACHDNMIQLVSSVGMFKYSRLTFNTDSMKYSALNLANLTRFGTMEVRTFRGTSDVDLIKRWTKILHSIKLYSRTADLDPLKIVEFAKNDPRELYNMVFGEYSQDLNFDDKVELLEGNLWYAAKIATQVKNWGSFGIPKIKKITNGLFVSKLNELSAAHFGKQYSELNVAQRVIVEESFYLNNPSTAVTFDSGE